MAPDHHKYVTGSGASDRQKHQYTDANDCCPFAQLQKAVIGFFLVNDIHGTMFVIRHITLPFLRFSSFAMKPEQLEAGLPAALRRVSGYFPKPRVIRSTRAPNFTALMQMVKVAVSLHQRQTIFAFPDRPLKQGRKTFRRCLR